VSIGKLQRDPDGKLRRNADGKLIRFTADGQPCCCEEGGCRPDGCGSLVDIVDEGKIFPAYYRVNVSSSPIRTGVCIPQFTQPTTACPQPIGFRSMTLTNNVFVPLGSVTDQFYLCRRHKLPTQIAGFPQWFYGCAKRPFPAFGGGRGYSLFGPNCVTPAPPEEVLSQRIGATIGSTQRIFSVVSMEGDPEFPNTPQPAAFCQRWRHIFTPIVNPPPPQNTQFHLMDFSFTDQTAASDIMNLAGGHPNIGITSSFVINGGGGSFAGGPGNAPYPIPDGYDPANPEHVYDGGCNC
jgi:hypothetical protein